MALERLSVMLPEWHHDNHDTSLQKPVHTFRIRIRFFSSLSITYSSGVISTATSVAFRYNLGKQYHTETVIAIR